MELAENITSIMDTIKDAIGGENSMSSDEILTNLSLLEPLELSVNGSFSTDLEKEIRAMILDLEEKMDVRAIGHIECTTDRETWRNALESTGDTVSC